MSEVESEATMIVYVVAEIGRDGEYGNVVGYNPIKGFLDIDKAKVFAREQIDLCLARQAKEHEGVKYEEAVDEDVWTIAYSFIHDDIAYWNNDSKYPRTVKRQRTVDALFAILTVEVDNA